MQEARDDPKFEGVEFDVLWRPFQLNANALKGKGVNKMDMYLEKFGKARCDAMLPQMIQTGLSVGIRFSYGGFTGNTFNSHRLIWKAREEGGSELQDKVVESLFKAYFEEEKSMGETSVLVECAKRAGMGESGVKEFLEDTNGSATKEVQKELDGFRRNYRVSGVPFFVFNDNYTMSGAQPASEILSVFKKLV